MREYGRGPTARELEGPELESLAADTRKKLTTYEEEHYAYFSGAIADDLAMMCEELLLERGVPIDYDNIDTSYTEESTVEDLYGEYVGKTTGEVFLMGEKVIEYSSNYDGYAGSIDIFDEAAYKRALQKLIQTTIPK